MTAQPSARETLTREQILAAATAALRRYGPSKMTVLDVARALGMSHGSVYRHFPTKAALRAAVVEQGLAELDRRVEAIAVEHAPAVDRMYRVLLTLVEFKQGLAREDPELLETYCMIGLDSPRVAYTHMTKLIGLLDGILADGVASGEIRHSHVIQEGGGHAVWYTTSLFHDPAQRATWSDPTIDEQFRRVWLLVRSGLTGKPD